MSTPYFTLKWMPEGKVRLIDQRVLPSQVSYIDIHTAKEMAEAIRSMVVRGAPAIGVSAAYGMALTSHHSQAETAQALWHELQQSAAVLKAARPTAVNLAWAIDRILKKAELFARGEKQALQAAVLDEAAKMEIEDVETNRQMGLNALPLIPQKAVFIHHCNTGTLATVEYGTALGVIRTAHENGREVFVYVDETRPRLQGARLTAWELSQSGIPHAVIVDGASGYIMKNKKVDLVTVGCDRVAANGDTANKVGTYNLAMAAKYHGIPFYIVGPTSTVDLSIKTGQDIPIEERNPEEVLKFGNEMITLPDTPVCNPAFDVTPAELITAIITEKGVISPPFEQNLRNAILR